MRKGLIKAYFKYCEECGNRFQPKGRFCKYCEECIKKRRKKFWEENRFKRKNE